MRSDVVKSVELKLNIDETLNGDADTGSPGSADNSHQYKGSGDWWKRRFEIWRDPRDDIIAREQICLLVVTCTSYACYAAAVNQSSGVRMVVG